MTVEERLKWDAILARYEFDGDFRQDIDDMVKGIRAMEHIDLIANLVVERLKNETT